MRYRENITPEAKAAQLEAARLAEARYRKDPHSSRGRRKALNAQWAQIEAVMREAARLAEAPAREAARIARLPAERERQRLKAKALREAMTPEQREAKNAQAREYRARVAANPDSPLRKRERAKAKSRRALKRGAQGKVSDSALSDLLAAQSGACAYCGVTEGLHLDHKTAVSRGGQHELANLQYLCAWHNMSKGAQSDDEYRQANDIPGVTPWDNLIF